MKDYSIDSEQYFQFIGIKDSDKTYYGGAQKWLDNKSKTINGCGPVAAANLIGYLAQSREKYKDLYSKENFSKESFSEFQREIYNLIRPSVFGLISMNHFIKKITEYGISKDIELKHEKLNFTDKNFNYNSCYSFIRNALIRNIPVAVINLDLRKKFIFSWHWVVITRIYTEKNKNIKIVVSSWGKRYVIDYIDLYNSMKIGGGLVYFY